MPADKKGTRAKRTLTKSELVERVTAVEEKDGKFKVGKRETKFIFDALINEISAELERSNKVQITGFGTFEVRSRKARSGVKPGTTEKIKIPASKYPAFKPGKALKDRVKGSK